MHALKINFLLNIDSNLEHVVVAGTFKLVDFISNRTISLDFSNYHCITFISWQISTKIDPGMPWSILRICELYFYSFLLTSVLA